MKKPPVIVVRRGEDEGNDVYGIHRDAVTLESTVVIIKSKALKALVDGGMSDEEADEFFEYNVAGSLGEGQYSVVDDTIEVGLLQEMLEDPECEVVDPMMEHYKKTSAAVKKATAAKKLAAAKKTIAAHKKAATAPLKKKKK